MSEERFDRIEQRLDGLESGQAALRAEMDRRFDQVDQRFGQVDQRLDEQGRQMRVLHEDVIARIAAAAEYRGLTKDDLDQSLAELWERIDRRLDPIEAAIRTHSADIADLRRART